MRAVCHKALSAGRCDGLKDNPAGGFAARASQSPVSGQVRRTWLRPTYRASIPTVTKPCQRAGATDDSRCFLFTQPHRVSQSPVSGPVRRTCTEPICTEPICASQSPVSGQVRRTSWGPPRARRGSAVTKPCQRAGATDSFRPTYVPPCTGHKALSAGRCDGLLPVAHKQAYATKSQSPVSGQVRRTG